MWLGFLFLFCLWLLIKFSVQWHYHVGFESRRQQEARLLVEAVCNTVEGASLANEFAKCEQARIILGNGKVVWMKALEKTFESTIYQAIDVLSRISANTAWNVLICAGLVCATGVMCSFTTEFLQKKTNEIDLFSPVAQQRLLASSFVDIGNQKKIL
jgi:hypothetical protein